MVAVAAGLVIVVGAATLVACGDDPGGSVAASTSDGPAIVATTSIWADVVANVACEGPDGAGSAVEIEALMPAGADPHTFELSLADRALLDQADLVVANGVGLESNLEDPLRAAEADGVTVLHLGERVDVRFYSDVDEGDGEEGGEAGEVGPEDEGGHHHQGGGEHDHDADSAHDHNGGVDPHLWFDPERVSDLLDDIGVALVDHAGLDAVTVEGCIDRYRAKIEAVHQANIGFVERIPPDRRLLVTNHEALGYFADRYGFEVVDTVSPSASGLAEANPAHLEELSSLMEQLGITVVFAEAEASSDDAQALVRLVEGARVVILSTETLGSAGDGSGTYLELLSETAETITDALVDADLD